MPKLFLLFFASVLSAQVYAQTLVMAVNEGVTYRITAAETRERYQALADLIGNAIKRPVQIAAVDNYKTLRARLDATQYDLAFIHPTHHALQSIRDHNYRLIAVTTGFTDYKVRFLVRGDSPLKAPQELQGKKVGAPDIDSISSVMIRATLRDLKITHTMQYTRYQDAVPFLVENRFVESAGSASNAVVNAWLAQKGRVLFESRAVPIKHWIASPKLAPEERAKIREVLLNLSDTPAGVKILDSLGFKGFEKYPEERLTELTTWLGL